MHYIYGSINIPIAYYVFSVLIGFAAGLYCYRRSKTEIRTSRTLQAIITALLAAYLFLILSTTVLARSVYDDYQYMLLPLWSYAEIFKGNKALIIENIANTVMLAPVGFLLPAVTRMNGKKTVLTGFLISLSIELLQLTLRRGLFEFDDMIHNTVGCLLGYVIYRLVSRKKN